MRRLLMLLSCFALTSLCAEKIGNVEYELPKQNTEWKVANTLEGDDKAKSMTVIYVPAGTTLDDAKETFGAVKVDLGGGEIDQASIQKMYEMQFPTLKAKVTVLDKSDDSLTYEWSLSDGDKEAVHGWTRIFSTPDQTILLTYQTEKIDEVEKAKPIWLKVLKDAKVVDAAPAKPAAVKS